MSSMCSMEQACHIPDCCDSGHVVCQKPCDPPIYDCCTNPYSDGCQKVLCWKPVCEPCTPWDWRFGHHGISNTIIYICATPTQCFDRISINFNYGTGLFTDIAFHFDIRSCGEEVVRNTRRKRYWENEERDIPSFPFKKGVSFDMIIRIEKDKYKVAVNGQHYVDFCHRMKNLCEIKSLMIEGDVCISKFQACCYSVFTAYEKE